MFCKNCGKEFEGNFCSECGQKVNTQKTCPKCGAQAEESTKFCANCGYSYTVEPHEKPAAQTSVAATGGLDLALATAKLVRSLPIAAFTLFSLLLFALYSANVLEIPFIGSGNVYDVLKEGKELSEELYGVSVFLLVYAIVGTLYSICAIAMQWRLKTSSVKAEEKKSLLLNGLTVLFTLVLLIVSIVFSAKTKKELEENFACQKLLLAFSIVFLLITAIAWIAHIALKRNNPQYSGAATRAAKILHKKNQARQPSVLGLCLGAIGKGIKNHKKSVIVTSTLAAVACVAIVLIVTVLVPYIKTPFRMDKVEKIALGDSKSEVIEILGEPYMQSEYSMQYISDNAVEIIEEMKEIAEKMEEAMSNLDFEASLEYGEQASALEEKLNTLTIKYIEIGLENGKVNEVLYVPGAKATEEDFGEVKEIKSSGAGVCVYYKNGAYVQHYFSNISNATLIYGVDGRKIKVEYKDYSYEVEENGKVASLFENLGDSVNSCIIEGGFASIGSNMFSGYRSLTSITIPDSVTTIGDSAFSGCTGLANITIPDSVTTIGDSAFSDCKGLTNITIPDSVTSIGNFAFSGCSRLTSITLPDGITSIGNSAFSACGSLVSIKIPDRVTVIGESAFRDCSNLTSIVIPDSVTNIGNSAFRGCSSLTGVTIPDSVTSIGNSAFYRCTGLTSITIGNGVTSIGEYAFSACSSLTGVTIPDSVTSIGENAFYGCSSLTEITIPFVGKFWYIFGGSSSVPMSLKTVTVTGGSIGNSAFSGCNRLTSITIGDGVTSIGEGAFSGCSGLTSIIVDENNTAYKSVDGNLYTKDGTTLIQYAIGKTAVVFTIPDGVASIGNSAFSGGNSLTSVTIDDSVTSIGVRAFSGCTGLTSITIPDSVTSIGEYAFNGCSSLTEITIPFVGATKDGTSSTHFGYIFGANGDFYNGNSVPASLKTVTVTGGSIGNYAFWQCSSLTSVTIGDGVTSIGSYAFRDCSNLTSVTVGNSVTSIGNWAFFDCSSLTEITIPFVGATKDGTSNTHFGYIFGAYGYYDNGNSVPASLKTVTVTGGSIGERAFSGCNSLTSVTIGDSVTSIGVRAFSGCTGLTSITIPDSVTSIGSYAFYDCSSLTEITIPFVGATKDGTSSTHFGYIFGGVPTSLKTVTVTGGSIGERAFFYCDSLTSVTIGNGVTSIGEDAFDWCNSLTSITFEGTVAEWNAIEKGSDWNYNVPATEVVCTDGKVTL